MNTREEGAGPSPSHSSQPHGLHVKHTSIIFPDAYATVPLACTLLMALTGGEMFGTGVAGKVSPRSCYWI